MLVKSGLALLFDMLMLMCQAQVSLYVESPGDECNHMAQQALDLYLHAVSRATMSTLMQ